MDRNEGVIPQPAANVAWVDQTLRKAVLLAALSVGLVFLVFGGSRWERGHWLHETIVWAGVALIVACIVGRTWTALFIGGRKSHSLVTHGPYAVMRNPLYVFSIIGATGVGAQIGSIAAALICGFVAWAVFLWTARKEEIELEQAFGDEYRSYRGRVRRFWPNLRLWHAPDILEVYPRIVAVTFIDALFFLIAIPLAQALEYLHRIGVLPNFILLP